MITEPTDRLILYLHLARASELRQRPWVRDRFLVLAAVVAVDLQLPGVAACCRRKILSNNAGHLLGRYSTVELARQDPRFTRLVERLRVRYSRERAEHMLDSLGIDAAREGEAHLNELHYAASLLGARLDELEETADAPSPGRTAARDRSIWDDTHDASQVRSHQTGETESDDKTTPWREPFSQQWWIVCLILAAALAIVAGMVILVRSR